MKKRNLEMFYLITLWIFSFLPHYGWFWILWLSIKIHLLFMLELQSFKAWARYLGFRGTSPQYFNTIDSLLQGPRDQSSEIHSFFIQYSYSQNYFGSFCSQYTFEYTLHNWQRGSCQERSGSTKNNILLTVDLLLNFSLRSCI